MKQHIVLMVSIALLARYIHGSPRAARAYSPEMTSSLAGDATLQRTTRSADAVGDGSLSKSVAPDALSSLRGLGWHLGGKPISTATRDRRRRRRHGVDSEASGSEVDAKHVPSSIVRHRRHLQEDGSHRLALNVPRGGAAKRVRREWDDSVLSWIKRGNEDDSRKMSPVSSDYFNDLHSDDVGNDHGSITRIKAADLNAASGTTSDGIIGKRRWDEADLAWLKRYSGSVHDDEKDNGKRNWDDSVLTWIKRNGGDHRIFSKIPAEFDDGFKTLADRLPQSVDATDGGGRPFQRKLPDYEKRLWDDQEMAWL